MVATSRIVKFLLSALVLGAIAWHVGKLAREWSAQGVSLNDLRIAPAWLVLSAAAYAVAQFVFAGFWRFLLKPLGLDPENMRLVRAYTVGTLGKYIPGKAMVVVIRTALIRPLESGCFPIAVSVFFETTAAMLSGSILAGVCLFGTLRSDWYYWGGPLALAIAIIIGLSPPLFARATALVALPFTVSPLAFNVMVQWFRALFRPPFLLSFAAWLFFGVSAFAVMNGVGVSASTVEDLIFLTGVTALATTCGFFFVFLPSGVGIRELIIIQLLAPRYGQPQAVAASLILRLVWTLTEVSVAGLLYAGDRRGRTSLSSFTALERPAHAERRERVSMDCDEQEVPT